MKTKLLCRILAVASASNYSVAYGDRITEQLQMPHKTRMSALSEIQKNPGSKYDNALLALLEKSLHPTGLEKKVWENYYVQQKIILILDQAKEKEAQKKAFNMCGKYLVQSLGHYCYAQRTQSTRMLAELIIRKIEPAQSVKQYVSRAINNPDLEIRSRAKRIIDLEKELFKMGWWEDLKEVSKNPFDWPNLYQAKERIANCVNKGLAWGQNTYYEGMFNDLEMTAPIGFRMLNRLQGWHFVDLLGLPSEKTPKARAFIEHKLRDAALEDAGWLSITMIKAAELLAEMESRHANEAFLHILRYSPSDFIVDDVYSLAKELHEKPVFLGDAIKDMISAEKKTGRKKYLHKILRILATGKEEECSG